MNIIEWAFGKRITPAERLRKNQRSLEKTQREIEREKSKMEKQEAKLKVDIKKSAKDGNMGSVKIQAKDLVRTRSYIQKFAQMNTQLKGISLKIQTVRGNEQMVQSMKGATQVLKTMNRQMNLPALQQIAMDFERENDIMDQRQEIMDDAIDESTGIEEEEETDAVVQQVLDELGVELNQNLGETPNGLINNQVASPVKTMQAVGADGGITDGGGAGDDDLQARLNSLKR